MLPQSRTRSIGSRVFPAVMRIRLTLMSVRTIVAETLPYGNYNVWYPLRTMDGRAILLLAMVTAAAITGCASNRSDGMAKQQQSPVPEVAPPTTTTAPAPPTPELPERRLLLGRSVEDREIVAQVLGGGDGRDDLTLIIGAIHGNEPTSAAVADALLALLREHPELLEHRRVVILTAANPDGLARKLRTNKHLVDLNRNFPAANWAKTRRGIYFGGNEPASEPETLALIKLFEELKPARVVSIHSMDKPCNNYDGP